ncbi:MAG: hypothetical protein AAF713_20545 [Pseudomonadota bacterium]
MIGTIVGLIVSKTGLGQTAAKAGLAGAAVLLALLGLWLLRADAYSDGYRAAAEAAEADRLAAIARERARQAEVGAAATARLSAEISAAERRRENQKERLNALMDEIADGEGCTIPAGIAERLRELR